MPKEVGVPFPRLTAAAAVDHTREITASHVTPTAVTETICTTEELAGAAVVGDQVIEVPGESWKKAKGGGFAMKEGGKGNGPVEEMTVPEIERAMGKIGVLVAPSGGQDGDRASRIFTPKGLRDGVMPSSHRALLRRGPTGSGIWEACMDPPTLAGPAAAARAGAAAAVLEEEERRATVPPGTSRGLSTA